jgi:hypothetical protein
LDDDGAVEAGFGQLAQKTAVHDPEAEGGGAKREVRARVEQSAMATPGYSGLRAAVAAALTVHLGRQRPAKSLYFQLAI